MMSPESYGSTPGLVTQKADWLNYAVGFGRRVSVLGILSCVGVSFELSIAKKSTCYFPRSNINRNRKRDLWFLSLK
eukprot:SAG22_NODE_62_length_23371_cov_84.500602_26_plen_76_part_00